MRAFSKDESENMWKRILALIDSGGGGGGVTGVKGDAESTYRTGNVNLTSANVGALPSDYSGLSALTTPSTGDILPIEHSGTTYKIDYNALAAAILARLGAGSDNIVDVANGGTGAATAADAAKNITGLTWDLSTNNTTDSWVPVIASGKLQHRVIPAAYNSTPLAVSAGGTGAATAAAARTNLEITPVNIEAARAGQSYNGNIDDLRNIGIYYLAGATSTSAGSSNLYGMLVVAGYNDGSRAVQLYIDIWSDSAMFRRYGGTSWSAWKAFTLTA